MNEKIIEYAFGELDAQEAQRFEAEMLRNPSLAAEVEIYRSLRTDLPALNDIPEMQFSKERLRDAILTEGIKPKRSFAWFNWILAPSAVAGCVLLYTVAMNGNGSRNTQFVGANNVAQERIAINGDVNFSVPATSMSATAIPESAPMSKDIPRLDAPTGSAPMEKRTKRSDFVAKKRTNRLTLVASKASTAAASKMVVPAMKASVASLTSTAQNEQSGGSTEVVEAPIVLIDATTDSGAGAATATEVQDVANVVIGG